MSISKIITNNSVKLLSGLANNNDSIMPMVFKDTISNGAIVYTYAKEGSKHDARERAIEEFGTGAVWLFGIPLVKKILDKTIYPLLKLDPDLDVRLLKDEKKLNKIKTELAKSKNPALAHEKEVILALDDKNSVLKSFTNSKLYKALNVSKFGISTALSAIALSAIIRYKQKTTQDRIEKDFYQKNSSKILINNAINKEKKKNNINLSFCGAGAAVADAFMYNPIFNTSILDGVITGTRLVEARKGEKKEVALKELFQLFFIYALAKPIQLMFEKLGAKLKTPIELDPMVLFSDNLADKVHNACFDIDNLKQIITDEKGNQKTVFKDNLADEIYKIASKNINNPLIELLDKNGVISTIKNKQTNSIEAISFFKQIDEEALNKTLKNIESLNANIKNLSKIKAFKIFATLGNVGLAAWAMGVLQPKVNIWMRKFLNNGDNRNPAIINQEKQMQDNIKLQ